MSREPALVAGENAWAKASEPPAFLHSGGKNEIEFNAIKQKADATSLHNANVFLRYDLRINQVFVYDIFSDEILLMQQPPWSTGTQFVAEPMRDHHIFQLRAWLETMGIKIGRNDCWDAVISTAKTNVVNPPKDYFDTLKWDGTSRLDGWLSTYAGAQYQNPSYLQLVGPKWLMGAVARVYQPGCKFDTALILEGAQYIGKSMLFSMLATFNGRRFFTDESVDFKGGKDSLMKLQGKLIYEMSELASFRKAETDEIKAFISRQTDEYRPPYGRSILPRPRMFVIGGSVNPNGGYLTDPTGNRRYWPVACHKINLDALERDKEQLWAEAVYRYKQKERIWLLDDEYRLAQIEQRERMAEDALADLIEKAVKDVTMNGMIQSGFTVSEIFDKLNIKNDHRDNKTASRIKGCLVYMGYSESRPTTDDGSRPRVWTR